MPSYPIARARAPEPRPLLSDDQRTQPTRAPLLVDVRVSVPPSPAAYVAPPPEQKLASAQQHLAPRRKKPRVAVCEFSVSSHGGYSAPASATRKRRKPALQHRQTDSETAEAPEAHSASAWPPQHVSAPASIALSTSAAANSVRILLHGRVAHS